MTQERCSLTVSTPSGRVRGSQARSGVGCWRGLPYAAPPVGVRRFAAPEPAAPWRDVRDGTIAGAHAPQRVARRPGWLADLVIARRARSEDCLYLDVWAPLDPAARPAPLRPVVVWIHGGSFTTGTGVMVDGSQLVAEGDVVVVSINYRLGALGFVDFGGALGSERIASNLGLRDQVAALQWVHRHIEAFGGDPERVTIAGESAGSACVAALMASPQARGLFHGAIAQSGALTLITEAADASQAGRDVADAFGGEDLERLWTARASELVRAAARAERSRGGRLVSRPWWDGDVLPGSLAEAYANLAPVPLMIGTTLHEHRTFSRLRKAIVPLTRATLSEPLRATFGADGADGVLAHYPSDAEGLNALGTDLVWTMPSIHLAERQARHAPVWMYRLDLAAGRWGLGAFHGLDLMLLFPQSPRAQRLALGPPDPARDALAARLRAHWLAFVRDGEPAAGWPRYAPDPPHGELARATLIWDQRDRIEHDPAAARRRAWGGRDVHVP